VIFAPRRYGKSSLIWRAAQQLVGSGEVLVAQLDVMRATTKERFAEKLALAIYEDVASVLDRARDRAVSLFRGLRVTPTVTVQADGSLGFSFQGGYSPSDVDATIEHLLELPAQLAAERGRRVALVFDEFQEIVKIDRDLIALMRSVFQQQTDVSHVYLGSRRHMMQQIFNDENEPFWRSAKQMELGVIEPHLFAEFIAERFDATGRRIDCWRSRTRTPTGPRSSPTPCGRARRGDGSPTARPSTRRSSACCDRRTPTSRRSGSAPPRPSG
jgi:hypothetical protein